MVINPDGSIQFEGDVKKLFNSQGGAAGATNLAATNEAARLAKFGPEQVARMKAAGATFGGTTAPAAPSVATATNPAPVATAQAATRLTFGQRALRALQTGGRLLGAAGIGATGATSALKTAGTPTEDYERRFGVGPSNLDSPALRLVRDLAVRGAGALVDLGDTVNPFSGGARAPAAVPAPSGAAAATATPVNAEALMTGTGVPEFGTGAFRVGRRPAVALDSRAALAAAAPAVAAAAPAAAAPAAPVLGTEGGIFGNLVNFTRDLGKQKIAAATEGRDLNRAVKLGTLAATQQTAASGAENAISARLKAFAALETAGASGLKVTPDLMGNPVITDLRKKTALAPTVNKPVTEADIAATMKANKMTRQQVEARLRAEGRIP